jgi:hypothetical protein
MCYGRGKVPTGNFCEEGNTPGASRLGLREAKAEVSLGLLQVL